MPDDLNLILYGDWNGANWQDLTTNPGSLVPAGSDNDLNIGTGIGGVMTGNGEANSLTVAEPYPGFGTIEFDGTVSVAGFELSHSSASAASVGLAIAGGAIETSGTLIVGSQATLAVNGGGTLNSSGLPGLQDFGEIDVDDGTVIADQMAIQGTLDLNSGTGTIATLIVGSFSGLGGLGGTGVLFIGNAGSIDVTDALVVDAQQGTGTIDVNGGTLTVGGKAEVGFEAVGALSLTAGGSMTVADTFDLGGDTDGTGTLVVGGPGSTLAANGGLIVGDVGPGNALIGDGASVSVDGSLVIGAAIGGGATIAAGASVGVDGSLIVGDAGAGRLTVITGTVSATALIEIGVSIGGSGSINVEGGGASLSGNVLDVGGSATGAGGTGLLSIGTGDNVGVTSATIWSTGAVVLSGGTLTGGPIAVDGAVSGVGELRGNVANNGVINVNNGVLTVTGAVSGAGTLAFSGAATLVLGSPGTIGLAQVVAGLADGDRIELGGLTVGSAQVSSPGTITVGISGGIYHLNDVSFAAGASHVLTTGHDTATGDDYFQVACFSEGTRIATRHGEVAVENLRAGDSVLLASGGAAETIWIGRREVDARRHPEPRAVWPVRIAAGAFGARRRHRDLFLSPDHAVFVEDVLIPVEYLINGSTITQVAVDTVTYFHIELPRHDVVLAEGLPVESYLDAGDRRDFCNGGNIVRLHPAFIMRAREALGCAPLIVTGPVPERARRLIGSRAAVTVRKRNSQRAAMCRGENGTGTAFLKQSGAAPR